MKKSTLLISIALMVFSITAFGFIDWNNTVKEDLTKEQVKVPKSEKTSALQNQFITSITKDVKPDFHYSVGSRFIATVTKEDLKRAKTIIDILPKEATQFLKDYKEVKVSLLNEDGEKDEFGVGEILSTGQLKLLQSIDYASNFNISALCKRDANNTGDYYNYKLTYYMTVIPEEEAEYKGGQTALLNYLRQYSKQEVASTQKDELKSGKVSFIVAKDGQVSGIELKSTSGYSEVDEKMIELIQNTSTQWEPATNTNGEKIEQKLFFSFGMTGC